MLSFQRKSPSFESALSCLKEFSNNSYAFLWKRSCLFPHFNSLCEVNGVLLHFLNALLLEKITRLWNWLKLLTSIHKKLTSVSLKEKPSVPILQFTVRSEWSAASLSKCCPFRENHVPLKEPSSALKHSTEIHMGFSEREAVSFNTSIHCAKWMECWFTF